MNRTYTLHSFYHYREDYEVISRISTVVEGEPDWVETPLTLSLVVEPNSGDIRSSDTNTTRRTVEGEQNQPEFIITQRSSDDILLKVDDLVKIKIGIYAGQWCTVFAAREYTYNKYLRVRARLNYG